MEVSLPSPTQRTMLKKSRILKNLKIIQTLAINTVFMMLIIETTYKNSFLPGKATICPAKALLETKNKGVFNSSKDRFSENSDFKSMNPAFHSISTSKHWYV